MRINRYNSRILTSAAALCLLALCTSPSYAMEAIEDMDVAIIGGGMSGLTAAYSLKQSGINATLFEGRDRLGGRAHTHYFNDQKTSFFEEGGTFIDDNHTSAIGLAKELNVDLIKRGFGSRKLTDIYQGNPQKLDDIHAELEKVHAELSHQEETLKQNNWQDAMEYDATQQRWREKPLMPYLSNLNDFGRNFLQLYYEDESGNTLSKASAFALPWLMESIEEYKTLLKYKANAWTPNVVIDQMAYDYTVKGGMSTFVDALAYNVSPAVTINTNYTLTDLRKDDGYELTFQVGDAIKKIRAQYVIMTLPFSTLRHVKIDESIGLREDQEKAIHTLTYGTNSKIGVPIVGAPEDIYDELLYYVNLDTKRVGWPGHHAFTFMVNGDDGRALSAENATAMWEQDKPAIQQNHKNSKTFADFVIKNWSQDRYSYGSYTCGSIEEDITFCHPSESDEFKDMRKYAEPLNNPKKSS